MALRFSDLVIHRAFGLVALLVGADSCTVYAPMQPTMPLVAAAGQAETAGNIQPNGRVEASVAYSPATHLLFTAGGTACPKLGTDYFLVTRQYEVGAGGYTSLGSSDWLLSGLGGYGQAVSNRGYKDVGIIIFGPTFSEYNARYSKLFAQAGIARVWDRGSLGFTYRLTQVRFATLTDTRYGELPLTRMARHEILFFARRAWGSSSHWESLATAGMSVSGTPRIPDDPTYSSNGTVEYEANRNLLPAFYASFGVVYRPNWGGR